MPRRCPHCGHETEAATCPLCGSDVAGDPGPGADGPRPVPWEDSSVAFPDDLVRTWRSSLFEPAGFFARLTGRGSFARPLLYFLLVTVAGAVFTLVWEYAPILPGAGPDGPMGIGPGVFFFLTPFVALVSLAVSTLFYHLAAVVLAPDRRGMGATARVLCYAAGPSVLAAIPIVGGLAGLVWTWVLQVVGLREVHRTSTGRAVIMVFWPWLLVVLLTAGLVALALVSGVDESLRLPLSALAAGR